MHPEAGLVAAVVLSVELHDAGVWGRPGRGGALQRLAGLGIDRLRGCRSGKAGDAECSGTGEKLPPLNGGRGDPDHARLLSCRAVEALVGILLDSKRADRRSAADCNSNPRHRRAAPRRCGARATICLLYTSPSPRD